MAVFRALVGHSDPEPHQSSWDWRIAAVAARQHGVIARFQLLLLGLSASAIQMRLRRGKLHPVHRGVYAVGHPQVTKEGRFMAAVLAGGPDAVASHQTAAGLYGIRQDNGTTFHVTVPRALHKRPGLTWHRTPIEPDETTRLDGIPVTTVPRTLFDLAATLGPRALERAMHEAEVRRLTDSLSLHDLLGRYPHRHGAPAVRDVLGKRQTAAITQNDFEEDFHAFLLDARLPIPAFNEPICLAGRWLKPDCTWHDRRLMAELDGRAVHDTTGAYENDRQKDRELLIAGWRTTRITWRQLHDAPGKLARELRALLAY